MRSCGGSRTCSKGATDLTTRSRRASGDRRRQATSGSGSLFEIFDVELDKSASAAAWDGHFRSGPLQWRSVNVNWYLQREGILDLTSLLMPDEYLMRTGPTSAATTSYGGTRPWCIDNVYLFDDLGSRDDLLARGRKVHRLAFGPHCGRRLRSIQSRSTLGWS